MANYTVPSGGVGALDKQLAANVVDTITFSDGVNIVEVVSDGAAVIYATMDGSTPTVSGSNTYRLAGGSLFLRPVNTASPVIKLISTGSPGYSVENLSLGQRAGSPPPPFNQAVALTSQTATAATYTSPDQVNLNAHALHVVFNLTAITGTSPSATVAINGKTLSGVYYPLLTSSALSATGVTVFKVGPSLTPQANNVANDWVPRVFQIVVTPGGTTPALTYTLDYNLSE